MKRIDPATELLTVAGSYMLALKTIRTLTTRHSGQHTLSSEQLIEQIREIAIATLEHRRPRLSQETLAYLAKQQGFDSAFSQQASASQQTDINIQAVREFTTEEIAWACCLSAMETVLLTVQTIRHVTEETEALAQALRLAANSQGNLFTPKRAKRLLALIQAMEPEERKPYIEQGKRWLIEYTGTRTETGEGSRAEL